LEVATGVGDGLCDSSALEAVIEPRIKLEVIRATVTIFFVFMWILLEKSGSIAL
jgi:hypothetical protein